jgi:anthraniloyl-CoA monooxygenase
MRCRWWRTSRRAGCRGGLERYRAERNLEALKLQSAARNRMEWFENVARYTHLEPQQFAYSLLTASQRIGHANLRLRDPEYVDASRRISRAAAVSRSRGRPCSCRCAWVDGARQPRRGLAHGAVLGARRHAGRLALDALRRARHGRRRAGRHGDDLHGADARITPGCTGLWNEAQREGWRRIVDFVHRHSPAKIALQLGHAGRKGSTQLGWQEMDRPLPEGNWPLISASAVPYFPGVSQTPRAMTEEDRARIAAEFVRAAQLGAAAGFDMLELHMAHGYLLASFLSPLTNQRKMRTAARSRIACAIPLEVLRAVRAVWPASEAAVGANFGAGLGARRTRRSRPARRGARRSRRPA